MGPLKVVVEHNGGSDTFFVPAIAKDSWATNYDGAAISIIRWGSGLRLEIWRRATPHILDALPAGPGAYVCDVDGAGQILWMITEEPSKETHGYRQHRTAQTTSLPRQGPRPDSRRPSGRLMADLAPAMDRFAEPVVFDDTQKAASEQFRLEARDLGISFDYRLKPSREKSLALTALEEALMWANKALALHGVND